jgi:DNA-dependent RNA polymerase/DNA-directed RNA polymerase N-terminal
MQSQLLPARLLAIKRWRLYHHQPQQHLQQFQPLHQQLLISCIDTAQTPSPLFSTVPCRPQSVSDTINTSGKRTFRTMSFCKTNRYRQARMSVIDDDLNSSLMSYRKIEHCRKSYMSTPNAVSATGQAVAMTPLVEHTVDNLGGGITSSIHDQNDNNNTSKKPKRRSRLRELSSLDLELGCTNEEDDDDDDDRIWEEDGSILVNEGLDIRDINVKNRLASGGRKNVSLGQDKSLDFLFLPSTKKFHPGLGRADASMYYDSDEDSDCDSDEFDTSINNNNIRSDNNLYDDDDDDTENIDIKKSLSSPMEYIASFDPQNPPSGDNAEELQYWLECQSQHEAVERFQKVIDDARDRKDYGSLSTVQRQLVRWFPALQEEIAKEQRSFIMKEGDKAGGKNRYGPYLCILPPSKLAIIVSHEAVMGTLLRGCSNGTTSASTGDKKYSQDGVSFTQLVARIGQAVEEEVVIHRVLHKRFKDAVRRLDKAKSTGEQEAISLFINDDNQHPTELQNPISNTENDNPESTETPSSPSGEPVVGTQKWAYAASHLKNYLDEIAKYKQTAKKKRVVKFAVRRARQVLDRDVPWSIEDHIHLGAKLFQIILDTATIEVPSEDANGVGLGGGTITEKAFNFEKRWQKKEKTQSFVTINERLYNMIVNDKLQTFGITTTRYKPLIVPPKPWTTMRDGGYKILRSELLRFHGCNTQKDVLRQADLSTVFDGLNSLGRVKWKVNKQILQVAQTCWDRNIPLGDIPTRTDFELPSEPISPPYWEGTLEKDSEEFKMRISDQQQYQEKLAKYNRLKQKNMDLRSLRCSVLLKLDQAEKFQNFEQIYFPYNMDFRGRAYPIPPHLSNVGSDLCRGILKFADAKPLGERGFYWLKVHLANFAGKDKMKFDDRAAFVDANIDNVRASVNDPFGEGSWWMSLEDPFQGLATCYEIIAAIDSGDPTTYMCSLPVHMDGSCNGLQHYAALGRDRVGGKAVNLCATDEPQDVYVGVMHEVIKRVAEEAERHLDYDVSDVKALTPQQRQDYYNNRAAKLVNGLIDRGVVKRTVMTSVYGVTYIGARKQIQEKIESKVSRFCCC